MEAPAPNSAVPSPSARVQAVYSELRRLAQSRLAALPGGGRAGTLQATALVHEAYVRLSKSDARWDRAGDYFAAAAVAMRDIIVERARRASRLRHGGGRQREPFRSSLPEGPALGPEDLLSLHEALDRLERIDRTKSQIVSLRFFCGLTVEQTAEAMGLSAPTVKREWAFARAWLYESMAAARRAGDHDG